MSEVDDERDSSASTRSAGRHRLRRQLHRDEHVVPRPDAVGPGAHGVRAEQRGARPVRARHAGRPALEPAHTRSCSTHDAGRVRRRRDWWTADGNRGGRSAAPRPAGWTSGTAKPQAAHPDRLPAAPAGRPVAGAVLRRPALLAGGDEPVRPDRRRRHRLRDDVALRQLRRRDHRTTATSCCGRSSTPASRRSLCLLLGYPLAYAIAFKAGRWKNLMLVLVIAPFFTSFLIRTLAWQLILADQGFVADRLRDLASARRGRPAAGHTVRRRHAA